MNRAGAKGSEEKEYNTEAMTMAHGNSRCTAMYPALG
jgi:hypothetical protein